MESVANDTSTPAYGNQFDTAPQFVILAASILKVITQLLCTYLLSEHLRLICCIMSHEKKSNSAWTLQYQSILDNLMNSTIQNPQVEVL